MAGMPSSCATLLSVVGCGDGDDDDISAATIVDDGTAAEPMQMQQ